MAGTDPGATLRPFVVSVVLFWVPACGDRTGFVLAQKATADSCGMQKNDQPVAFCERFSQPTPVTGRSGPLEGSRWSVARLGGRDNIGQGIFNASSPSTLSTCAGSQSAQPDGSDLVVCNGQLRESTNDDGSVNSLGLSAKQPFDFSGRTGTIAFDVTNDTSGSHGTWPELWLTDELVPAPFVFQNPCGLCSFSRHAVGIAFSGHLPPFAGPLVPNCPADGNHRWTIGAMVIVRGYDDDQRAIGTQPGQVQTQGCVVSASGPDGPPNHIEVRVSSDQIEVWATDPGGHDLTALAVLPEAGLTFTRGFLTLADVHNDAAQSADPSTKNHTYSWSNVAFDGPVLPGVRTFDVADALALRPDNTLNLGWLSTPTNPVNVTTPPISAEDLASATEASLVFNVGSGPIATYGYALNGVPARADSPFPPDSMLWHSVVLPVSLASLTPGSQSVSLLTDEHVTVTNVSVILVGGGEGAAGLSVGCDSSGAGTLSTILSLLACGRGRRRRRDF